MKEFAEKLGSEIKKGLPGTEVQWEMASSDRLIRGFPRTPREDSASAAVLILLYPDNNEINTLFIQRPDYDGVHGGQISFPGGKREKDDIDLEYTALREASEETGISPPLVTITGTLTPLYIPVSNIVVTPVVAYTEQKPLFKPDNKEVVFIIEAPVKFFLDESTVKVKPFAIHGEMINIRYYDYKGHVIWGATAMMLHELLVILRSSNLSAEV